MQTSKFYDIIGEVVLTLPLLITSAIFDMWFECILIVLLLLIYKPQYPIQYHANKNSVCIAMSYATVIVCLAISFTFRKQYLVIVLLCNVIAFVSSKVGELQLKAQKFELIEQPYYELVDFYNEQTKPSAFDVDTCTQEELLERCLELHLSAENIQLAQAFFIDKTKQSIIADQLCIDEKSVTTRKKRLKKKLNKTH